MSKDSFENPYNKYKIPPTDVERAFAVDVFEHELRDKQKQLWEGVDHTDRSAVAQYHASADELANLYVLNAGMAEDNSQFEAVQNAAAKYSWNRMDDVEWMNGVADPAKPGAMRVPGRMKLQIEQGDLFGKQLQSDGNAYVVPYSEELHLSNDNPEADDQNETKKSLEEMQSEIEILREDVSATFAKRMKVGVFNRKKKRALQSELDEKKNLLAEATKQRNNALVEKLREEGMSDEQVVEKLAEQSNADVVVDGKSQRKAMMDGNFIQRNLSKGIDKYANMKTSHKLAAGALAGLALVPVGVATGAAVGVAGVVGAAGLLATKTVKTYALNRAKIYAAPDDPKPIECKTEDSYRSVDDVLNDANNYSGRVIDSRIEKGDKIKKRATIAAMGSIALVGFGAAMEHSETIAAAGRFVGDKVGSGFNSVKESVGDIKDRFTGSDSITVETQTPEGASPPSVPPESPGTPASPAELPPAGNDGFNIDTFAGAVEVSHGEGWYQTFGELGIMNQADQAKLLNNDVLMAKLSNMNLAYVDNSIGGWGIKMPADGKMPTDALKLIRETAQQSHLTLSR